MRERTLNIGHLYPDLLNLYGDRGNIQCLKKRCLWRGIGAEVHAYERETDIDFAALDIILLGGGSDREQMLVSEKLLSCKEELKSYVEDGGVLIAVCGGYQLLGDYYQTEEQKIPGISLVEMYTGQGKERLVGNIILSSERFSRPVVGFENHGGRTFLGDCKPFGRVLYGKGNDGKSGYEGVIYKNVIGTYLHGPLLPKNPQVADDLIARALERKYGSAALTRLDDREEEAANAYIVSRFLNKCPCR